MLGDSCTETDRGRGNKDTKWEDSSRGWGWGWHSALPVLADVEAPLPGKVVCPVVISEEGCDHVGTPHQRTPWCLLHRSYKLILLGAWTVTSHHVHGLVHWGSGRESGAALCPTSPHPAKPPGCPFHMALTSQTPTIGVMQTLEATDNLLIDLKDKGC